MSIKLNIFRTAGATLWSRVSVVLIRLLQIPFLLTVLGVEEFGRWTVLYSLPAWLNLTNMGFGSVAANEMSMAVSAGDMQRARSVFSTTLVLVVIIGVIGSVLLSVILPIVPWEDFLNIPDNRHGEMAFAALWLGISIFVTFFYDISFGRFRAAHKTHTSVLVSSFFPWMDLLALFVTVQFTKRFDYLGLSILCSSVVCCLIYTWWSRKTLPTLTFSLHLIDKRRFKGLFWKGIHFQAFPLGNALLYQGNIIIVQGFLGPAAVAVFATARTLVRTVNQAMELINQSIWPELSHLFGAGDLRRAAKVHRIGVIASLALSWGGVLCLVLFGRMAYGLWVGKAIVLPEHLLILFLLPIPFNALWFTSSVVHMASNQHEGLATRYVAATALAVVASIGLVKLYGIEGAAISAGVADLVLIPYVLRRSLKLTGDSWAGFSAGLLEECRLFFTHVKVWKQKILSR